jgi:hypothetical protein
MGLRVDYPCGCVRVGDQLRLCEEHQRRAIVTEAQPPQPLRLVVLVVILIVTAAALVLMNV